MEVVTEAQPDCDRRRHLRSAQEEFFGLAIQYPNGWTYSRGLRLDFEFTINPRTLVGHRWPPRSTSFEFTIAPRASRGWKC